MSALLLVDLALVLAALVFFGLARWSWRGRRRGVGALCLLVGLVGLLAALLGGAILVGTRGYRALVHEAVAATVVTRPAGPATFRATFRFPDGERREYVLSGDELYVDARILKWKPMVNLLGLHTEYELDRVAGRYLRLEDERSSPRTVHSLGRRRPFDFFHLARALPIFDPLVDAEYGSASFVPAAEGGSFELRVSTAGLLFRPAE